MALGNFEYQILGVLITQPNDAYGATIHERLEANTGRDYSIGSLYTTLERLERKGFLTSEWGEATPTRGGRRRRYYKITGSGREAIRETETLYHRPSNAGLLPGVA